MKHKKQKLSGGLEKQQLLKRCLQDINELSVKKKPRGQRSHPEVAANQNLSQMGRSEGNLSEQQKNTHIGKSSSTRKKKRSEVENAMLKNKCGKTEPSYQSKKIDSLMLLNKNVFKTARLQESLNIKLKSTNSVKRSVKGKKVNESKLKHEASNQSKELVKSCLKIVDKICVPKSEKKRKTHLSNKQKNFAKVEACRKLRNQQKLANKREPRKSMKSTSLIKSKPKTNTSEKNKKRAPTHKTVGQQKMKQNILPASQVQNLKRLNLKSLKQNLKNASNNEDDLPLIYLLRNRSNAWHASHLSKPERNKRTKHKEQKFSELEKIIFEMKGMHTGQKNVKKRKVVHQDKVLDPYFALEQNIKDLKAQNSKLLKQINTWQRRGKIPSSKKSCKEKALIKNHDIYTQTYVKTVTAKTQTEISFVLQEDITLNVEDNSCTTQTYIQRVAVETQTEDLTQDNCCSTQTDTQIRAAETQTVLQENTALKVQDDSTSLSEDQGVSNGEDDVFGSNSDHEDLESKKMSLIDLEENSILECDGSSCENGENNADHRSTQNFQYIEMKNCDISQKLEPLWNRESSSDMNGELLCSKEEPKIVEVHGDEAQCSRTESSSQTTASFGTRPDIIKVEAPRNDYSLLQQNQLSSNRNSHVAHKQDTGVSSFSSSSVVYNGQAAMPQVQGWLHRSATFCNGYSLTQYVRPPYVSCTGDVNFAVSVQQAVVKLAENIGHQPLQQITPYVFIHDPLANTY